jgi:phage shock protein PspC (stress-responsive transcriptional regulator)
VNETISILGHVEDFVYSGEESRRQDPESHRRDYRRFYRDPDNYYIGGVASGMGEYFNIDPLWIRLAFVLLIFAKGVGVLIYLILWMVVPKARTTAERLQMRGKPVNLATIKDSVNEEFEKARTDNFSSGDRARNTFEDIMRSLGLVMVAFFKFILAAIGVLFLVLGSIFLAGLIMVGLGLANVFGPLQWNGLDLPQLTNFFSNAGHYYTAAISLLVIVLIPIVALIYGGIKILFNVRGRHPVLRAFLLTAWVLALVLFITILIVNVPNSPIEASGSRSSVIEPLKNTHLVLRVKDNTEDRRMTTYSVMGYRFNYSKWDEAIYDHAQLSLAASSDDKYHLTVMKRIKNVDPDNSEYFIDEVEYHWEQTDSVLYLNKYFYTDDDDFWLFAHVDINLEIPKGKGIRITPEICNMMVREQQEQYCDDRTPAGKKWLMSPDGILTQVN